MAKDIPITSSELGTLWMTYQKNALLLRMLDYFVEKENDKDAKDIMSFLYTSNTKLNDEIEQILNNEGAAIPIAFTSNDVHKDAPPLWDNYFDIMFLRVMMKLSLGFYALHLGMAYRSDIVDFYKRCIDVPKKTYDRCTHLLQKKGALARPPYVSMPKEVQFIEQKDYMKGIKLFGNKRSLNTVEIAHIYNVIESNVMGTQLMTGFAQAATESEVTDYFIEGKELAKKIVSNLTQIMQDSDIQTPGTGAGRATDSTAPPFSDKMMMFCSTLLSSFGLGANAIGTSLSLRSDLPMKITEIAMDTYQFASKGGKLMIKRNWLEEPPQMEDRNMLTKPKK
ncbi:MAG: DUF3231 family protein [Desulfotomaculaceae bacterium]|nr:DUF3231 family protein [Desulfotomaculaceae bacterium]